MLVLGAIGPTTHEENKIVCGLYPTRLTDQGMVESENLLRSIKDLFLLSDTLKIHMPSISSVPTNNETTGVLSIMNNTLRLYDITHTDNLNNRGYGKYENVELTKLRSALPPRQYRLWDRDFFESTPGGESLQDVTDRVVEYLAVLKRVGGDHIIIARPEVIKCIIGHVSGTDEYDVPSIDVEYGVPYVYQDF